MGRVGNQGRDRLASAGPIKLKVAEKESMSFACASPNNEEVPLKSSMTSSVPAFLFYTSTCPTTLTTSSDTDTWY